MMGWENAFHCEINPFGRLTVLGMERRPDGRPVWRCRCDCGNEVVVQGSHLRRGNKMSCGCLREEIWRNPVQMRAGLDAWNERQRAARRKERERLAAERREADYVERQMLRNQEAGKRFDDWWMFGDEKAVKRLRKMFR